MTPKQKALQTTAQTIIGWLDKRNMEGVYFETLDEALKAAMAEMPAGSVISWGGSETLRATPVLDTLRAADYQCLDRYTAKSPEETREIFLQAFRSDYYLMSTNAITVKGELINIDGNGNRVACLIYGPEHVFIFAGMNKVVADVESGIKRVRQNTCPPNAIRLNRNTPCAKAGMCAECLTPDTMCSQIVVTRRSMTKGRIKVFLIGEDLGF